VNKHTSDRDGSACGPATQALVGIEELQALRAVAEAAEAYAESETTAADLARMRNEWGTLDYSQQANARAVEHLIAALRAWKEASVPRGTSEPAVR
jgi:hypothetical protein